MFAKLPIVAFTLLSAAHVALADQWSVTAYTGTLVGETCGGSVVSSESGTGSSSCFTTANPSECQQEATTDGSTCTIYVFQNAQCSGSPAGSQSFTGTVDTGSQPIDSYYIEC